MLVQNIRYTGIQAISHCLCIGGCPIVGWFPSTECFKLAHLPTVCSAAPISQSSNLSKHSNPPLNSKTNKPCLILFIPTSTYTLRSLLRCLSMPPNIKQIIAVLGLQVCGPLTTSECLRRRPSAPMSATAPGAAS